MFLFSFVELTSFGDYLNDSQIISYGDIMLGNKKALEIAEGGRDFNHGIVTELNGKVLKVLFLAWDKESIGDVEKHIIHLSNSPNILNLSINS